MINSIKNKIKKENKRLNKEGEGKDGFPLS